MEAKIFISEIFFNSKSKVEKKKPEPIAAYHFVTGSCTGTVPYKGTYVLALFLLNFA
jgi:hypothetical protein